MTDAQRKDLDTKRETLAAAKSATPIDQVAIDAAQAAVDEAKAV